MVYIGLRDRAGIVNVEHKDGPGCTLQLIIISKAKLRKSSDDYSCNMNAIYYSYRAEKIQSEKAEIKVVFANIMTYWHWQHISKSLRNRSTLIASNINAMSARINDDPYPVLIGKGHSGHCVSHTTVMVCFRHTNPLIACLPACQWN